MVWINILVVLCVFLVFIFLEVMKENYFLLVDIERILKFNLVCEFEYFIDIGFI